jgi:hypothetical protein
MNGWWVQFHLASPHRLTRIRTPPMIAYSLDPPSSTDKWLYAAQP